MADDAPRPLKKRYRLTKLRLNEISIVDFPAQTDSVVHVFKRRADPEPAPPPVPLDGLEWTPKADQVPER